MPSSAPPSDLRTTERAGTREGNCPKCNQAVVCNEADASFDSQGFESYRLDCAFCETSLEGIVDPFDETLLLSAQAPNNQP
jgi:hypothetical protein